MNKKIFFSVIAAALFGGVVLAQPAKANEGILLMRGTGGTSGSCFAASVFVDGSYRVLATCRDLKTALSPELNRYVVWLTEENGKTKRLGEIVNGKLATTTNVKFTDLYITAESDGYINKPSENILLTGIVQTINFETGEVKPGADVTIAPTPTPSKVTNKVTPTKAVDVTVETTDETPSKGIGGALSTVLKIALFGFGALLLIVGVFSFISRKRAL